jgi:hypothetical protein
MNSQTWPKEKSLQAGFYKFEKLAEPKAIVVHKADLQLETYKERSTLDIVALYHPLSVYPAHQGSLQNRLIWVKKIHYRSDVRNVVSHAEWTFILTREAYNAALTATSLEATLLEVKPESDPTSINELSQEDMLRAYDIAKADPNIDLIDDDGTGDDLPPDDNSDPNPLGDDC